MQELIYPSKGFVKRMKTAVNRKETFQVKVSPGWRKNILLAELPGLLATDETTAHPKNKSGRWFIINMFRVLPFFTAYLYAKTGSYQASYINENDLVISLRPPK